MPFAMLYANMVVCESIDLAGFAFFVSPVIAL